MFILNAQVFVYVVSLCCRKKNVFVNCTSGYTWRHRWLSSVSRSRTTKTASRATPDSKTLLRLALGYPCPELCHQTLSTTRNCASTLTTTVGRCYRKPRRIRHWRSASRNSSLSIPILRLCQHRWLYDVPRFPQFLKITRNRIVNESHCGQFLLKGQWSI